MLHSVSMAIIFLFTMIVAYCAYVKRKTISPMAGMMVSMANAMMASVAFGTIYGIIVPDKDLTMPTMFAVSIGIIAGYVTGRPISLLAAVDGITAGIMGGMMGTMLGVMLMPKFTGIMIVFIDVIYLFVTMLLLRVIDNETKTPLSKDSKRPFIS